MPTQKIRCAYCGRDGKIDVWDLNEAVEGSSILFKYLGHNPLSGHMHFQCPFCGIVSLISPMAVLGDALVIADHCHSREPSNAWSKILSAREKRASHPAGRRLLH